MPQDRPPLSRNVKLLGWASCLNDIASEMIFPLLPQFLITVLGGNRFYLGIIEGVADSVASLLKLWSGAWSDRAGRRRGLVIFGYAIAAVARPLIGVVFAPWQLFVTRTGDRIGKGIRTSPRDAMIADSTVAEMRGRAFGFHRAMDHLGAAIGPVLATAFLWFWPGELRMLFLLTLIECMNVLMTLIATSILAGGPEPPTDLTIQARKSVERILPFLAEHGQKWIDTKKCSSCHHVPMLLWSHHEAQKRNMSEC